jgi:LmbE family N-acetylglucosaminyl deacetylase
VRSGTRVVCLYLTDGGHRGQSVGRRCAESVNVLRSLGVDAADIHFIGVDEGFRDGALHLQLDAAFAAVESRLARLPSVSALYMHAWEGGHQDHDAVHLIGAAFAARAGLLGVSRQFTLYRAAKTLPGVALFAPLAENGPSTAEPIPGAARLRYLRLSLSYPSQWRTWAVLLPLLAHAYATNPTQQTQQLSMPRLLARPHEGPLLYESRGFMRYDEFRAAADSFLRRQVLDHLPIGGQG